MKGEKNRAEENKTANYNLGLFSRDGENKTGNYMREKIGWTWQWTNRGRFDRQKKFLVLGAEFVSSETEKFSRFFVDHNEFSLQKKKKITKILQTIKNINDILLKNYLKT